MSAPPIFIATFSNIDLMESRLIELVDAGRQAPRRAHRESYYENGAFFTVTYARSGKMKQIKQNPGVALLEQIDRHEVEIRWVRGHAGHPENERCDKLAVEEARKYK